jgi:hypothetical protein
VKTPELFRLTKSEQRVVIVIVLALVGGAIAKHYREGHSHTSSRAITQPAASPLSSPREESTRADE